MWIFSYLLLLACARVVSTSTVSVSSQKRSISTMDNEIRAFMQSLELPVQTASAVFEKLQTSTAVQDYIKEQSSDNTALVSAACAALELIIGKSNVDTKPVDSALTDANWSQACWLSPACVLLPASTKDVSTILKFISFFRLPFATRSGGHSPNPGFSSIDDTGILIDLQKLNSITISQDRKVATIGPGARWLQVYEKLDPTGVTVIGGRIPSVGVGGLMLGGGLSHFSGEFGLAADNVKNFEIVLADGTVANANSRQNNDLFWALKGGGPNFGIVTRYDLNTVPIRNIWYQVVVYGLDQDLTILDRFATWQSDPAFDVKGTIAFLISLESITMVYIYSAPGDKPAAFSPFYDIPFIAVAVPPTNGTLLSLTQILASTFSDEPLRHDYRAASTKVDAQLYKDVYAFWKTQATAARAVGVNQTFTIQPITPRFAQVAATHGGNPLGLPQVAHQWWTSVIDWRNAADDAAARAASIATSKKWEELSKARGLNVPYMFMNDASRDQNPLASYGATNVQRLKTVSAKYDRTQVFQKLQKDGFLISKA